MNRYYLFIATIVLFISCSKPLTDLDESISFTNPLLPSGPDPWVIQKDSFYYYTHTSGDRIEIRKTKSMSRLANAKKQVILTATIASAHPYNIWAPELHYLDDKWYLYYSAGTTGHTATQRIYVLENSSIDPLEGTWVDKGTIIDSADNIFSIDGTLLELNNKRYFIWSSLQSLSIKKQGIYIAEMANPWTLATTRVLISFPQYSWEKYGSEMDEGINEGPEILKNSNGKVFLVYSASACWVDNYAIGLMALKTGGNPMNADDWVKNPNPVLKSSPISFAYGPGHNSFFKSPDGTEDWIIYHAKNFPNMGCNDSRNPRIQKFTWNSDGTPDFGQPVSIFKRFLRPSGEKD